MNVVLLFPPDRSFPSNPYASLPSLAPCLTQNGHSVTVRDINLELFLYLADEARLLPLYDRAEERMRALGTRAALNADEAAEYTRLVRLLSIPRTSLENVSQARRVMKDPEAFYDPDQFNRALDDLRCAQRFYFGENPLPSSESPNIVKNLFRLLDGPLDDPVSQAHREVFVDSILAHRPDLIGVSLPFMVAYYEAMKLMKLIKERAPQIPIILGGALVEDHKDILVTDPTLYRLFDYVCCGDGDAALPLLATTLEEDGDIRRVPNLYYRDPDGTVQFTFPSSVEDLNALPTPDFAGLRIDDYLIPETAAPFQTSRGCYYGRCTFCSEGFRENFRLRKPELIVKDMIRIHATTGIRNFYFWDSLCPPKTLKHVAEQVRDRNLDFTWFAETKMEKVYLPPEFMQTLHEGGCRFLQFGFESASQRVLNLIDKDNDLEEVERILDNMYRAGVKACMTWFIGFPTETEGEGRLTYDYIERLGPRVALSAYSGSYNLLPDQPLFYEQEKFGIKIYRNSGGGYEFSYPDGSRPYDKTEFHEAYFSRADTELLTHGAYLLYAKHRPDALEKLTGTHRLGPLDRHVPEALTVPVQRPPETVLRTFPRDIAGDFSAPPRPFKMVYQKITGQALRLRGRETAALELAAEPIPAREMMRRLGVEEPEMRLILHRLTNRGLLRFNTDRIVIDIDEAVAEYAGSFHILKGAPGVPVGSH